MVQERIKGIDLVLSSLLYLGYKVVDNCYDEKLAFLDNGVQEYDYIIKAVKKSNSEESRVIVTYDFPSFDGVLEGSQEDIEEIRKRMAELQLNNVNKIAKTLR
ncbi:MAG: hypothetical protein JW791_03760 [Nanoarchaeota archaeon]|nr:hypothetical protein [Nanoarchaeota archaeon]